MANVDIFFLAIQYSIYIFIGYIIYRKYILPYLLQERQGIVLQKVQAQERFQFIQQRILHFKQQQGYLTDVFKKIISQNKISSQLCKKIEQERNEYLAHRQADYNIQHNRIDEQRGVRDFYKTIASSVINDLEQELIHDFKENQHAYLHKALKVLSDQSLRQSENKNSR